MSHFAVYDTKTIREVLDYESCAEAVAAAMIRLSAQNESQPQREIFEIEPGKLFGLMPGTLSLSGMFGVKAVSVFPDRDLSGHTAHRGVVVLFDSENGQPVCVADAGEITRIRTAAASVVASHALARADACSLGVLGCGTQAVAHIEAFTRAFELDDVLIWGRSHEKAVNLALELENKLGVRIEAKEDPRDVAMADIVCTVTSAEEPVLFGDWLRPGTHVNVIGSSRAGPVEVDNELVAGSRYVVDSLSSALTAASEFLVARDAGLIDADHIVAEIGDVLSGRVRARNSGSEITVYKSLGHIVQDIAATACVHRRVGQRSC